ncbi:MAG: hypothetical protein AABY84_12845 [Candidatus Firestonebacteria bacterium]
MIEAFLNDSLIWVGGIIIFIIILIIFLRSKSDVVIFHETQGQQEKVNIVEGTNNTVEIETRVDESLQKHTQEKISNNYAEDLTRMAEEINRIEELYLNNLSKLENELKKEIKGLNSSISKTDNNAIHKEISNLSARIDKIEKVEAFVEASLEAKDDGKDDTISTINSLKQMFAGIETRITNIENKKPDMVESAQPSSKLQEEVKSLQEKINEVIAYLRSLTS